MKFSMIEVCGARGTVFIGPLTEEAVEIHLEKRGYRKKKDVHGWRTSARFKAEVRVHKGLPSMAMMDDKHFN